MFSPEVRKMPIDLKGVEIFAGLPGHHRYDLIKAQLRVKEVHSARRPNRLPLRYLYLRFRDGSAIRDIYIAKLGDI